jgi:hypothetical protein
LTLRAKGCKKKKKKGDERGSKPKQREKSRIFALVALGFSAACISAKGKWWSFNLTFVAIALGEG